MCDDDTCDAASDDHNHTCDAVTTRSNMCDDHDDFRDVMPVDHNHMCSEVIRAAFMQLSHVPSEVTPHPHTLTPSSPHTLTPSHPLIPPAPPQPICKMHVPCRGLCCRVLKSMCPTRLNESPLLRMSCCSRPPTCKPVMSCCSSSPTCSHHDHKTIRP
jgi:hypothetical protein